MVENGCLTVRLMMGNIKRRRGRGKKISTENPPPLPEEATEGIGGRTRFQQQRLIKLRSTSNQKTEMMHRGIRCGNHTCTSIHPSVHPHIHPPIHTCIHPSIHPSVPSSVLTFIHPSNHKPIRPRKHTFINQISPCVRQSILHSSTHFAMRQSIY